MKASSVGKAAGNTQPKPGPPIFLGLLPVLLLLALVIGFRLFLHSVQVFEPPFLLPVFNTFLFLASGAIALIALRSYLLNGAATILWLGCGVLTLGTGALTAGWLIRPFGPNVNVTIFNVAVLLASICHTGAVLTTLEEKPGEADPGRRRRKAALGYVMVLTGVALLVVLTVTGLMPLFFIQGKGPTELRQYVVEWSIVLFTFSSLVIMQRFLRQRAAFLFWYSLALALVALAMLAFFLQPAVGSPIGWLGRSSYVLAATYFLIAVSSALSEARVRGVGLKETIAELFGAGIHWREILATVSDAVVAYDEQGRILMWNKAAERIFGYPETEVIGKGLETIIPNRQALTTSSHSSGVKEIELTRWDGSGFSAEFSLSTKNTALGLIATLILRDITARKRGEAALQRQHAILAGINRVFRDSLTCETEEQLGETCLAVAEELTGSKFGFIGEINKDGNLNDLAISYLGWEACKIPGTQELVLPQNFHVHGIYGVCLRTGMTEIANDPASHTDSIGVPEGHPPITAFLGAPLKHGGQTIGMIGLANKAGGYTEADREAVEALSVAVVEAFLRWRAEQAVRERTAQLEAANQELEAFTYSVSHDLKAPVRAIQGFSRMLLEERADGLDAEGVRLLKVVCSNTQVMTQLIDDLLALSRLGRLRVRKSVIDVGAMTRKVFDQLQAEAPERDLRVNIGDLPPAWGDQSLLFQVMVNLLSNAVKYTKPRTTAVIEVGAKDGDNETVYYVKDNGIGFDERYIHHLFGVFQRLHSSEEFEGSGVGLAIVKRIIQRHEGRVWAEGQVDGGATFYFTLPKKAR